MGTRVIKVSQDLLPQAIQIVRKLGANSVHIDELVDSLCFDYRVKVSGHSIPDREGVSSLIVSQQVKTDDNGQIVSFTETYGWSDLT